MKSPGLLGTFEAAAVRAKEANEAFIEFKKKEEAWELASPADKDSTENEMDLAEEKHHALSNSNCLMHVEGIDASNHSIYMKPLAFSDQMEANYDDLLLSASESRDA